MDFSGKSIPDPGFAGDDGSADPALAAALAGGSDPATVLGALAGARLLVPVVALVDEVETGPDGLRREKSSDMAVPTITGATGRRALPAFTSTDALARWQPDARPVPVDARRAALATYAEDADTLLLDLAGPYPHEVTGPWLAALAEGREPVAAHEDADIAALVREAAAQEEGLAAVYLAPGRETDMTLLLVPAAGVAAEEIAGVARRVAQRLSEAEVLRMRLGRGMDLALLPEGATPGGLEPVFVR